MGRGGALNKKFTLRIHMAESKFFIEGGRSQMEWDEGGNLILMEFLIILIFDSDNDGIPDVAEAGGIDSDFDGLIASPITDLNGTTVFTTIWKQHL